MTDPTMPIASTSPALLRRWLYTALITPALPETGSASAMLATTLRTLPGASASSERLVTLSSSKRIGKSESKRL